MILCSLLCAYRVWYQLVQEKHLARQVMPHSPLTLMIVVANDVYGTVAVLWAAVSCALAPATCWMLSGPHARCCKAVGLPRCCIHFSAGKTEWCAFDTQQTLWGSDSASKTPICQELAVVLDNSTSSNYAVSTARVVFIRIEAE